MLKEVNQGGEMLSSLMRIVSLSAVLIVVGCASSEKEKQEERAEIHYNHGTGHLLRKNYTEALEHLMKAVKLGPEKSKYHNNLGMAYYFKDEKNFALMHLKKSLELDPQNSDAKTNLASVYYSLNKPKKSIKLYREVLKDLVYKGQHRVHYNIAMIAKSQGKRKMALNHLQKSRKIKDDYCPALFHLGLLHYEEKKYKKALKFFDKGGQGLCFNNPAPQYYQAKTLIELKEYAKAKFKLDDVIERFQSSPYSSKAQTQISRLRSVLGEEYQTLKVQTEGLSAIREKKARKKKRNKVESISVN